MKQRMSRHVVGFIPILCAGTGSSGQCRRPELHSKYGENTIFLAEELPYMRSRSYTVVYTIAANYI